MKIDYLINLSMTVRETDKMFDKRRKQKYLRLATALNMWKSEFGVETVEEIINYPRWQYTWKRLPLCGKGSLNTFLELLSEDVRGLMYDVRDLTEQLELKKEVA